MDASKVHLDGYNITDALAGKAPDPRHEFFYFNDDGSLVALRYDNWKVTFAEQRAEGFDDQLECGGESHAKITKQEETGRDIASFAG